MSFFDIVVQNDERRDALAAFGVGDAADRDVAHEPAPRQCDLDLRRADTVAGTDDQVVRAPAKANVALFVAQREVTRSVATVLGERRRGRVGVLPVPVEDDRVREVQNDLAGLANGQLFAVLVDDPTLVARVGSAHRVGLRLEHRARTPDEGVRFRLPVALVDRRAERLAAPREQRPGELLPARHHDRQRGEVVCARVRFVADPPERRRRNEQS